MDLGRNELKTLTETLITVLHEHTAAIEKGLDPKKLTHNTIINSLLKTIEKYRSVAPPSPSLPHFDSTLPRFSKEEPQVLHGAPVELTPTIQPKQEQEELPEGPKDRTIAQSDANGSGAGAPIGQAETPPLDRPTNSPVITRPIEPPSAPLGNTQITPDNIDALSEGLIDDSLEEPKIEAPKIGA